MTLTVEKIARDRAAAAEQGLEAYIEATGVPKRRADEMRKLAKDKAAATDFLNTMKDYGGKAMDWAKQNPEMAGAGVGAAGGALFGGATGGEDRWRNAILGALAGGGAGAGAGAVARNRYQAGEAAGAQQVDDVTQNYEDQIQQMLETLNPPADHSESIQNYLRQGRP